MDTAKKYNVVFHSHANKPTSSKKIFAKSKKKISLFLKKKKNPKGFYV